MSHKFALIENVSFKFENDLNVVTKDNLKLRFDNGVKFFDFSGTKDLFTQMNKIMGTNMLELINCSYDKTTVIQSAYIENDTCTDQKIIFFKRKLNVDDSYTFLEFNPENPDIYQYESITKDDLVDILYNKHIHNGIISYADGNIENIEYTYIDNKDDDTYGSIMYKRNGSLYSIKYLNLVSIMQNLKNDSDNNQSENIDEGAFNEKIQEKITQLECTHIYGPLDFSLGTFNCYYPFIGNQHNDTVTNLLGREIHGNVLITLETCLNNDERLLNLDNVLFDSIVKTIKKPNFKPKNRHYFNIYHELL